MEISLLQAFALGIIAFIAGLDMFNGLTHMHRPVVLGPLVGLVLGDLHTGILTGGTLELVWMGLAPLAGAQPPNVIIGTIVGTAFAITTGVKPDVAVGVAVPFAVAVQMGITFLFSVMSGVMSRCDRMAENADTRGIERVNYLALLALGTFYFLCAFLPIYFGAEHAKTIIDVLPQRLIDGLGVAGGIMPAIGFAVLLKIMMKNVYIPYFILGFVAAAWLKLPVLAIAAAALAMALIEYCRKNGAKVAATTHYAELKLYAMRTDGVMNASCEFDVETLRPTYRLLIGIPGKSNAFAISKRLGLSDIIIDKARSLVNENDRNFEDVLRNCPR